MRNVLISELQSIFVFRKLRRPVAHALDLHRRTYVETQMASTVSHIRTSLAIGAAIGTITTAALVIPSAPTPDSDRTPYGIVISARLVTSKILAGAYEQNLAVTLVAPDRAGLTVARPSLTLAIVIDRSGSMHGRPIENAKAAAHSMLRQLDSRDSFSIVTYSSGAASVIQMQPATDANKSAAHTVIETIDDAGGTCISCGLEAGAYEVMHARRDSLRRILLISDGQANEGIHDRAELAQLAARTAAAGVSISTVGVGLDFDESTMRRLAEVGRGNTYFVEDTVALSAMFLRELATLSQTVASDMLLTVHPGPGVRIEEPYGYPMTRGSNGEVLVPVADIRAGETRKVVFRINVTAAHAGPLVISNAEVRWHDVPDTTARSAHVAAEVDVVDDPAAVAASTDRATMQAVERALSARALDEASTAYDRDGIAGARRVLERRSQAVRANAAYLGDDAAALEAVAGAALEEFAKEPAKAKKTTSVKSYELAR